MPQDVLARLWLKRPYLPQRAVHEMRATSTARGELRTMQGKALAEHFNASLVPLTRYRLYTNVLFTDFQTVVRRLMLLK